MNDLVQEAQKKVLKKANIENMLMKLDLLYYLIFRKLFKHRIPAIFLPTELRLIVQMRRGSSTSFSTVTSIAFSISRDIPYRFDDGYELHVAEGVLCPLDQRAVFSKKSAVYVSHFSNVIPKNSAQKVFIRLRNPVDQFYSYVNYLTIYHASLLTACDRALTYLRDFSEGLENINQVSRIVLAEDYFLDQEGQITDLFNYFEIDISSAIIYEAIEIYSGIEKMRRELPSVSPRKSYKSFNVPIPDEFIEELEKICLNSIFHDYYPHLDLDQKCVPSASTVR